MKLKQKLAEEYADPWGQWRNRPLSEETSGMLEQAFLAGFEKAREMCADALGPPWRYANLSIPSGEITWDREGLELLQKYLKIIGEIDTE